MVIVIRELTLKLKIEMINSTTNNAHTRYLYLDSPFLLALTNLYPDNKIPTANSPIKKKDIGFEPFNTGITLSKLT